MKNMMNGTNFRTGDGDENVEVVKNGDNKKVKKRREKDV